ncbi:hypothetical protein COCON_G00147990 [Conger conger]|uniref:Thyroglobulin type-1 domain-containing protein n=1 Tax=Conger conger TaxID=82655 RepID=A0A9Q1HWA4_CONCO|nr:insulin-like growth factor-binding protein 6 [Conger conger]KAJ8265700.1 hypothetical protein COCON_G00147990 [Conger conger]
MLRLREVLALAVLLAAQPGTWSSASRPAPQDCTSCRGLRAQAQPSASSLRAQAQPGTSSLAVGEPCGVYTLSCAQGLRCTPPQRHHSPLQALLQGRGVCTQDHRPSPTQRPVTTGPHPSHSGELEKAPCRTLLNTVLRHLELTHFPANRDIYIPNCDMRGFYRKKQCHSSKGMRRGLCWCVDEQGAVLQNTGEGAAACDSE